MNNTLLCMHLHELYTPMHASNEEYTPIHASTEEYTHIHASYQ